MTTSTVTSKGQVTIPKAIREGLRLRAKDRVVFTIDGDHAILHAVHGDIRGLRGVFHRKRMKPLDFTVLRREFEAAMADDVRETLKKSRA